MNYRFAGGVLHEIAIVAFFITFSQEMNDREPLDCPNTLKQLRRFGLTTATTTPTGSGSTFMALSAPRRSSSGAIISEIANAASLPFGYAADQRMKRCIP